MTEEQNVYQRAVIKFGVDKQLEKLEQELLELLLALSQRKEGRPDHNVHEEIADVEIMLRQIKPLFNENSEVDQWFNMKIERLNEIIRE